MLQGPSSVCKKRVRAKHGGEAGGTTHPGIGQ